MLNNKKSNKKIFAFMNSYSSGKSGGDVLFLELCKYFNQYAEITVITSCLGKKLALEYCDNLNFIITDKRKHFKNIIFTYLFRGIKALFFRIKLKIGDVLYGTSDFLPDVLPIFFYKLYNKKVMWVQKIYHIIPSNRKFSSYAQNFSFFLIKLLCNKIIVINSNVKEYLIKKGFDEKKIEIIYPGINLNDIRNKKYKDCTNYSAVFVSRLTESKGIYELIEIWSLVCKKINNAKLAVIGSGDTEIINGLAGLIKVKNLENNINMLGYLKNNDMYSIIQSSKLFVFPSHEEGFGLSIAEAMALETPVIVYNLDVYKEIYEDSVTYAELLNTAQFADKIVKLLNDEKLLAYYSKLGLEIVKRYDISKCAEKELTIMGFI
jgi:glycosyltransferase involved in cell wall biosynthesis